jgi:hypothetical protein
VVEIFSAVVEAAGNGAGAAGEEVVEQLKPLFYRMPLTRRSIAALPRFRKRQVRCAVADLGSKIAPVLEGCGAAGLAVAKGFLQLLL